MRALDEWPLKKSPRESCERERQTERRRRDGHVGEIVQPWWGMPDEAVQEEVHWQVKR